MQVRTSGTYAFHLSDIVTIAIFFTTCSLRTFTKPVTAIAAPRKLRCGDDHPLAQPYATLAGCISKPVTLHGHLASSEPLPTHLPTVRVRGTARLPLRPRYHRLLHRQPFYLLESRNTSQAHALVVATAMVQEVLRAVEDVRPSTIAWQRRLKQFRQRAFLRSPPPRGRQHGNPPQKP